jgi:hypothetical protein
MAETKRQMVHTMSSKKVLSPVEKRIAAVTALKASRKVIKTIEDAKKVLSEINTTDTESVAAGWYREYSRKESQLKALIREYKNLEA